MKNIHFHSAAAKRLFIKEQHVGAGDILSNNPASLIVTAAFAAQADWAQNHAVYSVSDAGFPVVYKGNKFQISEAGALQCAPVLADGTADDWCHVDLAILDDEDVQFLSHITK